MSTLNFRTSNGFRETVKERLESAIPTYTTPEGVSQTVISLSEDKDTHNLIVLDIFGAFFAAAAVAISDKKFKTSEPAALVFSKHTDEKNPEFIAALIAQPNGESYAYRFTYNKADIDGITNVVDYMDYMDPRNIPFTGLFDSHLMKAHYISIMDKSKTSKIIIVVLNTIRDYLDSIASETEKMELVINDVFNMTQCTAEEYEASLQPFAIASVEVERGGNKKFEIVFSDNLLVIAKDGTDNISK